MYPTANWTDTTFPTPPTPAFIASLIESAANAFEVDLTASRKYLFQAFALLRAQAKRPRAAVSDPTRGRLATWQARRVIAYIEDHLCADIQAKHLANLVNLSVSHFFRAFKISVGMPPCEYVTRRRIEFACEMMRATDEPLSQIALACGLNDQSSLCRVFRRTVGQSPRQWRRDNSQRPMR